MHRENRLLRLLLTAERKSLNNCSYDTAEMSDHLSDEYKPVKTAEEKYFGFRYHMKIR